MVIIQLTAAAILTLMLGFLLWFTPMTEPQAQMLFDQANGSIPTIYNAVSTTGSIRAGQFIIPVQGVGVTPTTPVSGTLAMNSVGQLCVYNGSTWAQLGAVSLITGLAVGCMF